MNRYIMQLVLAYMGVVIGGGFASGQEVLQFFTGYGLLGITGTVLSGVLFVFLSMQIARISKQQKLEHSHKEVLHYLFGVRGGAIMDMLLTFFLCGVGIVMLAATGSLFQQQYGLNSTVGSVLMMVLVMGTLYLNIKVIINLISAATPLLMSLVIVLLIYTFITAKTPLQDLLPLTQQQETVASNWFLSALLYASFNIVVGFPVLVFIAKRHYCSDGYRNNAHAAIRGSMLGGVGLGLMIFLINIGLLLNLDRLQHAELPTVMLAAQISPWLGTLMTISMIGMIYSTAVGMFFAFAARFATPQSARFKAIGIITPPLGLLLSFAGFTKLINIVYPLLGYLGLILGFALFVDWIAHKRSPKVFDLGFSAAPKVRSNTKFPMEFHPDRSNQNQ